MIKDKFAAELAQAAENVANHTVELVSGVGKYGTNEIWRCTNNGSSCYGFDLVISRFGIAMYGDVDSLVFGVGSSYGIEFLARQSVCGYMISKLEPEYREKRELDEDKLRQVLVEQGCQLLEAEFVPYVEEGQDDYNGLPEWLHSADYRDQDLNKVLEELKKHAPEHPHCKFEEFCDCVEELLEDRAPNGLQAVEAFLAENCTELYLGPEWYEYAISKHDSRLIQRLEMLRLCALKIAEVKKAGDSTEEHA
jgi:hypothetical protein